MKVSNKRRLRVTRSVSAKQPSKTTTLPSLTNLLCSSDLSLPALPDSGNPDKVPLVPTFEVNCEVNETCLTEKCQSDIESFLNDSVAVSDYVMPIDSVFVESDDDTENAKFESYENIFAVSEFKVKAANSCATTINRVKTKTSCFASSNVSEISDSFNAVSHSSYKKSTSNLQISRVSSTRKSKHNVDRPCLYCGKIQTNLKRHMVVKHNNEIRVLEAVNEKDSVLKNKLFEKLRKEGIFEYNRLILKKENSEAPIQRQRTTEVGSDRTVYCTSCFGFYNSAYFRVHRKACIKETDSAECLPKRAKTELLALKTDTSSNFQTEILSKFLNNPIGDLCCKDESIVMFVSRLYEKMSKRKTRLLRSKEV